MIDLYDNTGRRITLGEKIGAGGEGAVYEVKGLRGDLLAAKIYHEMLTLEKQAKLLDMVSGHDESLKNIAAWPSASLHPNAGGPVRGFLMPKLTGYQPIHHLYGPSHRKQRYPDKDWAFLVNTARNVAAAFEVIHGHGHVIGDVNPNLVFVAENSIVKLIDCDSFQIVANDKHHLCEVGVPHFTPPELQSVASFRDVQRTQNHDNFGLALLLFHILLMGRHPYAGVFSGKGDLPLEKAIQQFCYAYGRHAASKRIAPPPMSVTPAILPEPLVQLFEQAFAQQGYQLENRPTAREWVKTLDPLKRELSTCKQESAHKYFSALPTCPWCLQEQQSGNSFFIPRGPAVAVAPDISAIPENQGQQGGTIQSPPAAPKVNKLLDPVVWFPLLFLSVVPQYGIIVVPLVVLYLLIKWFFGCKMLMALFIEVFIIILFLYSLGHDDFIDLLLPRFISSSLTQVADSLSDHPSLKNDVTEAKKALPEVKSKYAPNDLEIISSESDTESKLRNQSVNQSRIKFVNAVSAYKNVAAQYMKDWEDKVERIGNLNYPAGAINKGSSATLVMEVGIKKDGSIYNIHITQSSGNAALDEAAKRIVKMSAPFAPLPDELLKELDVLMIPRAWTFSNESDKSPLPQVYPKPSSAIDEKKSASNSSQLIPKLNHGAELRNSRGKPIKVEPILKHTRVIGNKKYRPDVNSLRRALNPYQEIYESLYTLPQIRALSSGSRKSGNVEFDVNLMIPLSPRRIQHSTGGVIK